MLQAYMDGKDLYVEIASIALHLSYNECLEHFPKDTPIIKRDDGKWYYATEAEIANKAYTKLADGETDTYKDGKERRNQAKKILLGIMYGRGENSIAEQLGCSVEEAREIKNSVYDEFPGIKNFERTSAAMVREKGFVTTLWGRKRRLPDYNLPNYSFEYVERLPDGSFQVKPNMKVPESIKKKHTDKLNHLYWKKKSEYIETVLYKELIKITDNGGKIADASRQIINSRVQGCLDGNIQLISKEYGSTSIKDHVNETLTLWDGGAWTPGTIIASGKKKKCVIHFEDGSEFICSPDHKFKVILEDGSFIWKKCSELHPSDNIDSFEGEINE